MSVVPSFVCVLIFSPKYPDDFPSQSSSRKAVRRKELLLNGEEVRNDSKVMSRYPDGVYTSRLCRAAGYCIGEAGFFVSGVAVFEISRRLR